MGERIAKSIQDNKASALAFAEREMVLMQKNNVRCLPYNHPDYPQRLLFCQDAPLFLFVKGETNLNSKRVLSFVGTRQASEYGKEMAEQLIKDLVSYDVLVVSGLAYGIDLASHKAALKYQVPTACVLAHGLSSVYPQANTSVAKKMLEQGGAWISEYSFETEPEKGFFPSRNRIIAGMADAIVVVESALKGGSLITAEIALSYQRELFAVPGRAQDIRSQGCNYLIHSHKATLCTSAKDIVESMGWDSTTEKPQKKTYKDYSHLEGVEKLLVEIIRQNADIIQVDMLIEKSGIDRSKVLSVMLGLEIQGIVKTRKGSSFELL